MKYFFKHYQYLLVGLFLLAAFGGVTQPARASTDNLFWGGYEGNVQTTLGLGNEDPRRIIANVVNVLLGFIGIIAVMIIMMAGFKLMLASGNDDAIAQARSMLTSGVVGLIIVLASFGLAQFAVNSLFTATGAPS